MDVAVWLRGLGLELYQQAFSDNAIDAAVLLELTEADLEVLGVTPLGHRKKLLKAIAALRAETGTRPDTVAGTPLTVQPQLSHRRRHRSSP